MVDTAALSAYKELNRKPNHPWHSGGRIGGDPIGSFETVRWVSDKCQTIPERIKSHIMDQYGRSTLFIIPRVEMNDDMVDIIQYIKDHIGVIFCIDCRGRYCPDELKKKVKSQKLSFSIKEIAEGVILIET